jgi:hypothetical protein
MAQLINRTPAGRIDCLYFNIQSLFKRFGVGKSFNLNEAKFSDTRENVHDFCLLLETDDQLGIKYCPYLENPLSKAGCPMTNSLESDSQKSKSVGNTINALHGLGWIRRSTGGIEVTASGAIIAQNSMESPSFSSALRKSMTGYGPFVGLLAQINGINKKVVQVADLKVGYPDTAENIQLGGRNIPIRLGSKSDTNTRTKSILIAWALAAGFLAPLDAEFSDEPHNDFREQLNSRVRDTRSYQVTPLVGELFKHEIIVDRPLEYKQLTQDFNAWREFDQKPIREAVKVIWPKIRNRRLALISIINEADPNSGGVKFDEVLNHLKKFDELFITDPSNFKKTMQQELSICFGAGLPYDHSDGELRRLTKINNEELNLNVPDDVLLAVKSF